jgi:trypsin
MRAAVLFPVLLIAACGGFDNEVRFDNPELTDETIVGGYESTPGSRPYQISLQESYYGHFCGGALIASDWVLTAAHCVAGSSASSLQVRVGLHRLSSDAGQTIAVSQIIRHSGYNSNTMVNDIALLELATPADPSYTPLALPTAAVMSSAGAPGDMVEVSGWGSIYEGSSAPDALQEVAVPVVSNTTCNNAYGGDIYDSMLCAGYADGGKDSCQGDSGGPMVADVDGTFYSVGVVSWGEGCARPGKYGVYTRT